MGDVPRPFISRASLVGWSREAAILGLLFLEIFRKPGQGRLDILLTRGRFEKKQIPEVQSRRVRQFLQIGGKYSASKMFVSCNGEQP